MGEPAVAIQHKRHEADFYKTPRWTFDALRPHLHSYSSVFDPCCGEGHLLDAACMGATYLRGIELDRDRARHAEAWLERAYEHAATDIRQGDALTAGWHVADLLVLNPPFSKALDFVVRAIDWSKQHRADAAVLLRLGWMAGQKRKAIHVANPSDVFVLSKRPSFTGDSKTDGTEYAWFVWGPGRGGRWSVL